ncbi:MAG TPA: hypothetical protein VGL48_11775 [Acidimicrobiales bacterium]
MAVSCDRVTVASVLKISAKTFDRDVEIATAVTPVEDGLQTT